MIAELVTDLVFAVDDRFPGKFSGGYFKTQLRKPHQQVANFRDEAA